MFDHQLISRLLESEQVLRLKRPDGDKFRQFENVPQVIEGIMDQWSAYMLWSYDYLVQILGDISIKVTEQSSVDEKKYVVGLSDFITHLKTYHEGAVYYSNFSDHKSTILYDQYKVPGYFDNWYKKLPKEEQVASLSWIYIGTRNSFTSLHQDVLMSSAWNAVFEGQKLWVFYPPEQRDYLYQGQVNPFNPDLGRFPKFVHARPQVCLQQPGEIVYTPSGWWHAVLNTKAGFALTENFINESNIVHVKNELIVQQAWDALDKLERLKRSAVQS